jgi:pimeloyl-ACP methyl ester carboxylesterase
MPYVNNDAVRIYFEHEGDGVPIVLHTGAGGDHRMWRLAGYVAGLKGMQRILMDHRGHGRSGKPREISDHRIDGYVDDVIRVIDSLGLERVVFFGYSDGSAVGYVLAARHPDRVDALVALGAVRGADETLREREDVASMVAVEGMPSLVEGLQEAESDPIPSWFEEQMIETDPEMFALELDGWADWAGPWKEFSRIEAPTLIVVGEREEDPYRSAADDAELAAATIPNGSCVILPGLGHVAAFVRSELVLPHVRAFLNQALGTIL